MDVFVHS